MFCTWFSRISTIFAGISFFSCISPDGFAVIFLTLGECPGWFLRKVAIKHGHMLLTCHTLCEKLQAIWQISQVITSFLGPSKSTAFSRKFVWKRTEVHATSSKGKFTKPVMSCPHWDVFSDFSKIKRSRSRVLQIPAIPLRVVACTFEPFYHFPTTLLETAVQRRVTVKKVSPPSVTMHCHHAPHCMHGALHSGYDIVSNSVVKSLMLEEMIFWSPLAWAYDQKNR